ncbi:hypothetical protein [Synechococcus sp. CBW1107]|uniref:hypothetical protein n=1 Tax=Synechococcus sp. CBW1107 TaxID=2789857 RepID=UPI002AD41C8E|nr:hypothetical protein [Synechococcus sp. CBW1107]
MAPQRQVVNQVLGGRDVRGGNAIASIGLFGLQQLHVPEQALQIGSQARCSGCEPIILGG